MSPTPAEFADASQYQNASLTEALEEAPTLMAERLPSFHHSGRQVAPHACALSAATAGQVAGGWSH